MDTLQLFIKEYHSVLHDWLYVLMIRLLNRQGHEVLASHQKAIQETLAVVRSHFPHVLQFNTCCRYVSDNTQTPDFRVKSCLLEHMKDLLLMMGPDTIYNSNPETVMAVSRIISWSTEPKSAEVRRMASRVVIKLFDLNPSNFFQLIQNIPRHFQDRAQDILKTYQNTTSGSGGRGINLMMDARNKNSSFSQL
ncbi:unnamed protein product [Protopolystoma xenopodis]|uniref:CLASP N-terminal domain-containing protein n=1 Tax=Protopolystoma xenopodis TaxID=117903 RepID=A0A3S5FBN6_9PLAT|nr:unnamed protein product [Protopolystoma xenopodis]